MTEYIKGLLKAEGWDSNGELSHQYYNATFLRKFGVFEKGKTYDCIFVDHENATINWFNEDGTVNLQERFAMVALNDLGYVDNVLQYWQNVVNDRNFTDRHRMCESTNSAAAILSGVTNAG
jgi:hypothetical protein